MDELEHWAQLSYELRAAVLVTCDTRVLLLQNGNPVVGWPDVDDGDIGIDVALQHPEKCIGTLNTTAGPVSIGVLAGAAALNEPMAARSLMLAGAELIVNVVAEEEGDLTERDDDVLMTRGFENAAAVARVSHARSAVANWCNDMIPDGCEDGQKLLALAVGPVPGSVVHSSFNLTALRVQRSNCIWGDAFRRPFQCETSPCGT